MSTKIFFLNSDDANYGEEELNYVSTFFFEEGVLNTQGADWEDWVDNGDLLVEQRAAGANMSVDVGIGNAIVETTRSGVTFKAFVFSTAVENKAVPANSSGVNRVDAVILRVDRDVDPNALMNNVATVEYITGTNGATAMSDGQIQTALGDDDDFIRLADITVEDSETQILDADISDERVRASTLEKASYSPEVLCFRGLSADPAVGNLTAGDFWYNTTDDKLVWYDGSNIIEINNIVYTGGDGIAIGSNVISIDLGTNSGLEMVGNKLVISDPHINIAFGQTAGETINGATLPVACYFNNTDDEWYGCDANVQTKLEFKGFAVSNGTDGNTINIQFAGIVGGFTGLTKGADYFVQDDGTIGTTVGTYEVLVGVAISTTEILIQKGSWEYMGNEAFTGSPDTVDATGAKFAIINFTVTYSTTTHQGQIKVSKKGVTSATCRFGVGADYQSAIASWSGDTITITYGGLTTSISGTAYFYR